MLDKRRTLTEKLVSLLGCSLANDSLRELSAKIRHFYDLYFLLHDAETNAYLHGADFPGDLKSLFEHDQQEFDKPEGWQDKTLEDSPLFINFHDTWKELQPLYLRELPDLAYEEIPSAEEIEKSLTPILSFIK